ncbi:MULTISPECIES: hypothetical protein [unclassified Sphingomonas]|uniref:hypothetical protein n=1 Tax=unclassified Sphingomonas TaxID=196159 RepID=UPI00226A13AA|nr:MULTISPECIES: hypothetical protein [unclassified Sphingomonas]
MSDFALLKRQHAEILNTARDLDQLLANATPNELPAVAQVRMRLAGLIQTHLITENQVLYEPLRQRGLTGSIPNFAFLAEEIQLARTAYSQHIGAWNRRAISENWNGYVQSTRKLLGTIEKLVRLEEGFLFPVAQRLFTAARQDQVTSNALS